ncbi:MAG: 6-pyruvoyl tetrahydropterin synthase [Methanomassiliicoccales archaeon PtaU1.Bin030]|nr:MAG: 6-pyruvoyl tetrahydropterin synthase [Methanomassiliicoccales archaeon PtaU1.Bin030]
MTLFETGLSMTMRSRHYLPQGTSFEREEHFHDYTVEAIVRGSQVDESGYLIDITALRRALGSVLERYRGNVLNDLPEFSSRSPTMENLAVEIWRGVSQALGDARGRTLTIRIWEDESAWACFEDEMR